MGFPRRSPLSAFGVLSFHTVNIAIDKETIKIVPILSLQPIEKHVPILLTKTTVHRLFSFDVG
jgi:hypothetical protein